MLRFLQHFPWMSHPSQAHQISVPFFPSSSKSHSHFLSQIWASELCSQTVRSNAPELLSPGLLSFLVLSEMGILINLCLSFPVCILTLLYPLTSLHWLACFTLALYPGIIHLYPIYVQIFRLGFESNVFVVNAFLSALIRHEKLLEAKEVFDRSKNEDIVSWNTMMSGILQYSYSQSPSFWYRMSCEGLKPDHFTFAIVFTALASPFDLQMGLQVHVQLIKSGHGGDICVGNSLCDMYIQNRRLIDGYKVFHEMTCKDVRSWTHMAAGFLQCGEPGKALELIAQMSTIGLKPNKFTLATALNACANLASLEEWKKFHGLRIKLGSQVDICVDNALLDMYAKSGCMDGAWVVFQSMNNRSVVSCALCM